VLSRRGEIVTAISLIPADRIGSSATSTIEDPAGTDVDASALDRQPRSALDQVSYEAARQ
jgi:hypothetical protein